MFLPNQEDHRLRSVDPRGATREPLGFTGALRSSQRAPRYSPAWTHHGSTDRHKEVRTKVPASQIRGDWGEAADYRRGHGYALVLDAGAPLHS